MGQMLFEHWDKKDWDEEAVAVVDSEQAAAV